jgi:hypothetical protein
MFGGDTCVSEGGGSQFELGVLLSNLFCGSIAELMGVCQRVFHR